MTKDINEFAIGSGRMLKEDNTVVNLANLLEDILAVTGCSVEVDMATLETLIGEKQETPTVNTLLGRLKSLETKLTNGLLIIGAKLAEQLTEDDAAVGVLTFAENIEYIDIFNRDAENDGVFLVNGISITVPAGASICTGVDGTPGVTVTVTGATAYIVGRYV